MEDGEQEREREAVWRGRGWISLCLHQATTRKGPTEPERADTQKDRDEEKGQNRRTGWDRAKNIPEKRPAQTDEPPGQGPVEFGVPFRGGGRRATGRGTGNGER